MTLNQSRTTAAPGRQRSGGTPEDPVPAAWADYLAAARQLDGVRRGAATAATEQARTVQSARAELAAVRTVLAPQQAQLRELGVSPISLVPTPPELSEATRSMVGGPAAVLSALRDARRCALGADDTLAARGLSRVAHWPSRPRNLLVYGPLGLFVPLLLVAVFLLAGTGAVTVLALVVALPAPAVAFGLGWLAVGRFFPPRPGERVDRTVRFGVLACLLPAVVTTAGIVLAMLAG
ncbi:hypothetical protein SAMN05443287_11326 [Micromonospora phaseoli]|uniref:Uncharacterized protein n=1 Tax=Micromonospora phaseoli TaxID=1144548 RepID=A0A1H7DF25_9ACTN|nr:hypothetical protein [Micromonospora phaseoli]PZV90571.1 hypothetical protein CLV64_113111 [Micromonospora phaseoli]GIJ78038.1 hypothetical protein Xph01_24700 [Micromonospora phaseoli]SEJ99517.1 hypothetical protein SAMN05443287_11326 [Micromonospora phaseoli]